jgi:hypothetical protein
MELEISPMSLVAGSLIPSFVSVLILKLRVKGATDKKILAALVCFVFGVLVAFSDGIVGSNWTIQGFSYNILTVLAVSQTVYGLSKKGNE